jgi:hypothetical protein
MEKAEMCMQVVLSTLSCFFGALPFQGQDISHMVLQGYSKEGLLTACFNDMRNCHEAILR